MNYPSRRLLLTVIISALSSSFALSAGKDGGRDAGRFEFHRPAVVRAPYVETCTHRYNNILLTVSNFGFFGAMMESYRDCETGLGAPSCEYPANSQLDYLYAAGLWVGAVIGADTLVSTGWDGWQWIYEMWPCAEPECGLQKRSNRRSSPYYHDSAKSDFEYIGIYTDTLVHPSWTEVDWDGRKHIPLQIKVIQTSYSWSVEYAQDFILIDYQFINMGSREYTNAYVGLLVDGDVSHRSRQRGSYTDDVCGFRESFPSKYGRGLVDTINLAWIMDNDGDPDKGEFDYMSVRGLTGVRTMRTPVRDTKVSFNWWTSNGNSTFDWGPMMEATRRNFGTGGLGTPEGDRAKYYIMSNGEQDYDQIFAARDYADAGWLPPSPAVGMNIARGGDARYLISAGPFTISMGDTLPFTIAYVGGENVHKKPDDFERLMQQRYAPEEFYNELDFEHIAENCVWAAWIYDNPGVDTDGNGYAGPFWEIEDTLPNGQVVIDTVYYAGDGVPDFRAVAPPPPPVLRASTASGRVTILFNGLLSETFVDPFTGLQDFEGYRAYMSRLKRADQFALVESRDLYDFRRFYWESDAGSWSPADDAPMTLDSFHKLYGPEFDPNDYKCLHDAEGFRDGDDVVYCFEPVDWNQSLDGWNDGAPAAAPGRIRKRFADQIRSGEVTPDLDSTIAANWVKDHDPSTGDSILYHKYYEYEFEIDNLLPSVPWYFSITAFDFGGFGGKLGPLESSPLANAIEVWPISDAPTVLENRLQAGIYPNPYIGDGKYAAAGYEDPGRTGFVDHERRMHFFNLPPECTITIFTLSGDLVREITHPGPYSDTDSRLQWNLRSNNNEIVTSGIYIFALESRWGKQIGKLVIIL